ncbi:MAG TPA: MFS transporter [Ktedonobacterales bacterium]|nr:MFS transporter [Ktedonobacterales bacterium]
MTTHPSPSQSLDADLHGQRTRRPAPFQWMASLRRRLSIRPGNAGLIVAARGLRSFSYGMLAVLLAVALTSAGISPAAIGGIITVSLAGDFCGTYVIGLNADRWGRRRTLIVLALLMAATGAVFGLTAFYPVLLVAAFFGTLGTTASETAPFLPIEQSMLPNTCPPERRMRLFARYNLVASFAGALGALFAGLPDLLHRAGISLAVATHLLFGVYVLAALAVALLAGRLSPAVEAPPLVREATSPREAPSAAGLHWRPTAGGRRRMDEVRLRRLVPPLVPPLGRSRGLILRLAALFSVDALAGGLVVQSLMVLYFHLRFGVPLGLLAALFFGANTLAALSFLAAAPLARRIGLLNTMVFTHLPSNVLLALVPLMPTFPLAAVVLLVRQLLSQMDVPTRQAYTMALVAREERTAAASVTSLARSAGSASTPVLSGVLLQGPLLAMGLPFLVAGGLKVAYDLTLWAVFRRVRLPEEK